MAYHRPTTLTDAYGILAKTGVQILAGGTDLFPIQTGHELQGDVIDITAITELGGISQTDFGWRIGACATWSDVANATLPPAFGALQQAAREVGALQIQNSATIAGNLCNASPAADGVPPLLVLEAEIEIRSTKHQRQMPLSEFITGVRKTALQSDEIVTAIHIPKAATKGRAAFHKLGARKYLVISICMVAARVQHEAGVIKEAAVSVGACGPVACRLPHLEEALIGKMASDSSGWKAVLEQQVDQILNPIDDMRADAKYRRAAAMELINRAISDAASEGVT